MKFSGVALSATLATVFSVVAADLQITNPTSSAWWVADSINTLAWTCQDAQAQTFTVSISNSDPKVFTAQPIIAIQNNFDCSKLITQNMVTLNPGAGYTVQFLNPLNSSQVYVTSDVFEVKPAGSAYPATTSSASSSATASNNSPSASTAPNQSQQGSDAMSLKTSFAGFAAMGLAVLGYVLA